MTSVANNMMAGDGALLSFIKNHGQEDEKVKFSTYVQGRKIFCLSDRITLL